MSSRLVMIPGTMCDRRLFAAVARRLRPEVAVQVARWRELFRGVRPAWLQGAEPISLLGFSLGGIWALDQLQANASRGEPLKIERLALVGSNAEPASKAHRDRARQQRHVLRVKGPEAIARSAKARYFSRRPQRWQAQLVLDMARRTSPWLIRKQLRLAAHRADGLKAFAGFPGPVAVLSGTRDRLCPPPQQRRLHAARADAVTAAWARCGHMVPLEAPGRLALAIRRWLNQPADLAHSPSGACEK